MRKKYWIMMLSVFLSIMSGCKQAPASTKSDAGVKQAVKEDNAAVKDIDNGEGLQYVTRIDNGYACDVKLGTDEPCLSIKATFEDMDYDKIPILNVMPSDKEWDEKKVSEAFFGENADLQTLDDIQPYNAETACDGTNGGLMKKTSIQHAFHIEDKEQNRSLSRFSDSSVIYIDQELEDIYTVSSDNDATIFQEENASQDYTFDMAKRELQQRLDAVGLKNPQIEYYEGYSKDGVVSYDILYTISIGNLELGTNLQHGDINKMDVRGYVRIGNKGIASLQAENMFWDITDDSKTVSVIEPDELMAVLEEHVNKGDIVPDEGRQFDTVRLMYMMDADNMEQITLKPVWRVYVTEMEYGNTEKVGGTMDIIVDAQSGELIGAY